MGNIPRTITFVRPFPLSIFVISYFAAGAHDRTRTGDPVLTKNVLYQLSYVGLFPLSSFVSELSTDAGGGGRIRTYVARRRRVYSPVQLSTLPPRQRRSQDPGAGRPGLDDLLGPYSVLPGSFSWSRRGDSNPQPGDYKSPALPLRHFGPLPPKGTKKGRPIGATFVSIANSRVPSIERLRARPLTLYRRNPAYTGTA